MNESTICTRHLRNCWSVACVVFLLATMTYSRHLPAEESSVKRYAVIVANNLSLDEGVPPLQFADDDGARYFETFVAAGQVTKLLALPDKRTQSKFPKVAEAAVLPNRDTLVNTLRSVFAEIKQDNAAGLTTHFTFVYAGHGNVGPNLEGYINLLDDKLTRKEFFAEVIAPSPATFNHIILDSCNSYFLVNKRGEGPVHREGNYAEDIRDFLKAEILAHYPNTGVILAASEDSETHEWNRLESGIFSHEILSAFAGTADVNEDGRITYQEAAACVEAANFGIRNQKARLNVYFRPPANRQGAALMDLSTFEQSKSLLLNKEMGGRYYLEDARGVRTVDLHFSNEQAVKVHLIGEAPFYLRTHNTEAEIISSEKTVLSSTLAFNALSESRRGSVEQSFRKHLFEVPFGLGFYFGMYAASNRTADTTPQGPPAAGTAPAAQKTSPADNTALQNNSPSKAYAVLGWSATGLAVASGIASGVVYSEGKSKWNDYEAATETEAAKSLREEAENRLRLSRTFMGLSIGLAATGVTVLILEAVKRHNVKSLQKPIQVTPAIAASPNHGAVGFVADF